MSTPLHFRVYPEGRRQKSYFTVRLFRSEHKMFRFYHALTNLRRMDFRAIVVSWCADGPELGQIFFAPRSVVPGIVTHEMVHAGMTWAARRKVRVLTKRGEEKLAQAVEKMTAQFWRLYEKSRAVK